MEEHGELNELPARAGVALRVAAGKSIRLVNTKGMQVVDTWSLVDGDASEFMSMEHTRVMLGKISPQAGDVLFTNKRRGILRISKDTTSGAHDTLRAACDPVRYKLLGYDEHASCESNFFDALGAIGVTTHHCPCPLNVFENCPVGEDGKLVVVPPVAEKGDYIVFDALIDCIVVFSACPMDVFPTNGPDCNPKPVGFQVLE